MGVNLNLENSSANIQTVENFISPQTVVDDYTNSVPVNTLCFVI